MQQANDATQAAAESNAPAETTVPQQKPFSYCSNCGVEYPHRRNTCAQCGRPVNVFTSREALQQWWKTGRSAAGFRQQGNMSGTDSVPSYLGWAIAVTLLCSWIFGIVAIIYAVKVGDRLRTGDYYGAREASQKAKNWCWVSFGATIAIIFIAVMIVLFAVTCS